MRGKKMKIPYSHLIQSEIDEIKQKSALTDIQLSILNLLLTNRLTDEGIALELGLSRSSYYRHKRILEEKIKKIKLF